MRKLLLFTMCFACACTYAELSRRGSEVRIADAPPAGCENVGFIIGKGGGGFGEFTPNESLIAYAMNDARNKAADLGATHVTLSPPQLGGGKNGTSAATVTGFAYRCEAAAPAPAGSQAVAK
jgi:hypothetical protein